MFRHLFLIAAGVVAVGARAPAPAMQDLVAPLDALVRRTQGQPGPARALAFRTALGPRLPGFYPRKSTEMDGKLAAVFADWPQNRAATLKARDRVLVAYAQGTRRFAKAFPGYQPTMPAYVIHSFGEMDGGTRKVDGRDVLIFGADVIAKIHANESISPLVDHELFHTYHQRFFPNDCDTVWCGLWTEGLATYVATRMNPKATDGELLLDYPKPIRAATDARFDAALCDVRRSLDAKDDATMTRLFDGGSTAGPFPARFGYYVGYRIVERIGRDMTLDQMAKLPMPDVRRRLDAAVAAMAHC